MRNESKIPGQFVRTVTGKELLVSLGIQLLEFANDLAFTDAPFGEDWSIEAANRMATLSQLLNDFYKKCDAKTLSMVIDLPFDVVGIVVRNAHHDPKSADQSESSDQSAADGEGGNGSIDDYPF